MGRRLGPLDQGQQISTFELLENVDRHGQQWPAALSGYTLEAVSTAVGREIMSGNLRDGATLSTQGQAALARLRRDTE
jgi:hypothetical protein